MKARLGDLILEDITTEEAALLAYVWTYMNGSGNGATEGSTNEGWFPSEDELKVVQDDMRAAIADDTGRNAVALLSPKLRETWNWLVANDSPEGTTLSAAAAAQDVTYKAMKNRMENLVERGFVYRVSRGRYRAGVQS